MGAIALLFLVAVLVTAPNASVAGGGTWSGRKLMIRTVKDESCLYVGYLMTNSINYFNSKGYVGPFIKGCVDDDGVPTICSDGIGPAPAYLHQPYGFFFSKKQVTHTLYVANANVDTQYAGTIVRYGHHSHENSRFEGNLTMPAFIDSTTGTCPGEPHCLIQPHGIIEGKPNIMYVADFNDPGIPMPGKVAVFKFEDAPFKRAQYLYDLDYTGYTTNTTATVFHPRGLAWSPHDDYLYVSTRVFDRVPGYVLRFNVSTRTLHDIFIKCDAQLCNTTLHGPEGLAWGPDGNLYVTSFRANVYDFDRIMVYDKTGAPLRRIALDAANETRSYAQHITFGPDGNLYVAISGPIFPPTPTLGDIRKYDITPDSSAFSETAPGNFTLFASGNFTGSVQGGPRDAAWYLAWARCPQSQEHP
jgi:sugar lactone lactonase YvrE